MKAKSGNRGLLFAIGIFKLLKGLLLLVLAFGLLRFLHMHDQHSAEHWIRQLRIDPNNRYVGPFLEKLGVISAKRLKEISGLTFFYAALLLTEGIGLLLQKRWAEYFTVIMTGSFIPLEVYEIVHHLSVLKVVLLVINAAIVCLLIVGLRKKNPS